jgi:iron complex transport system substrate-binding protein
MDGKENDIQVDRKSSKFAGRKTAVIAIVIVLFAGSFAAGIYVGSTVLKPLATGTVTVIDDLGREVLIPANPQRVISIAPSTTELLFALDLGDRIVAKDNNSDYPEEARLIPHNVSGFGWIDYEVILSLNPDLIFAAGINLDRVPELESRGYKVVVLEPMSMDGVFDNILLVGSIMGKSVEANTLLSDLKAMINSVTEKLDDPTLVKPRVYLEFDTWGGYWTYGAGSFGNELILLAGGSNIAANVSKEYVGLTSEFVIACNPEVIVYTTNPWIMTTPDTIKTRPGWDGMDAVTNDRIYSIDDNLVSRPGPRLIDGLEALAELFHPELFD